MLNRHDTSRNTGLLLGRQARQGCDRWRRPLAFLAAVLLALASHTQAQAQRLHYNQPAQHFEEALPIGNGTLGGMVYGRADRERISLNDITLWTGEPDRSVIDSAACAQALAAVREALGREDYSTADRLQRQLQGHYSENYQPLGTLELAYDFTYAKQPDGTFATDRYERWLDLSDATATTRFAAGPMRFESETFCSAPDQVMVVRLHCTQPFGIRLGIGSQLPSQCTANGNELILDGHCAYRSYPVYTGIEPKFLYDSTRGIHFRTIVKVLGLSDHAILDGRDADGRPVLRLQAWERDVVLLVATATSFNGPDRDPVRQGADYRQLVRSRIDAAAAKTYRQLRRRHTQDYQRLFGRMRLDLGSTPDSIRALPTDQQLRRYTALAERNPDLEELYFQYGRYLLISCSRTPGVPATLQGLWNESLLPPWSSNYTTNINLQENYWPADRANLSELAQPLHAFIQTLGQHGRRTARQMFGVAEGWCTAHNTDIWGMTNPVGLQQGDPVWANWIMGGTWLSTHLWEHYLYTRDTAFLRAHYPTLRGAAQFCMGWLVERDGLLITMPSTSPENKFRTPDGYVGATLYGGTADAAMIWECLNDTRLAAQALHEDNELCRQIDSALNRMEMYRIGRRGNLQEWHHDWEDDDPRHRHQSHLFGLFPGHSISPTDPAHQHLRDACRRTLELRGDESTGWSTGWRINLYARLHDGEQAYHMLRKLLRYISPDGYQGADAVRGGGTYPNLMDAHSPFQIDGNFGGCAGVCELLEQSLLVQPAVGDPLPFLPKAWQDGSVKGLRCSNGKTVDASWKSGIVTKISWR